MNKKSITNIILIPLTVGITTTSELKSVSTMTNKERFDRGWNDGYGHNILTHVISVMDASAFTHHSVAYQYGFEWGLDFYYDLHIPYYNYNNKVMFIPGNTKYLGVNLSEPSNK